MENTEFSPNGESSCDIFRFRRRNRDDTIFTFPPASIEYANDDRDDKSKPKRYYALLQKKRPNITYKKLRWLFLLYSTNNWQIFIMGVIFTSFIIDTWLYYYCPYDARPLGTVLIVIALNFFFTIDVAFLIALKVFQKWRKTLNIVEPQTIKVIIDGCIALPYSVLYLFQVSSFDIYAIVPLVSYVRDYRIVEYFYIKASRAGSNQWSTFLFQYLILFIHLVHTFACLWYYFGYKGYDINQIRSSWAITALHLPLDSRVDWYLVSAYWSIMLMTTNSLGDLYPLMTLERICAGLAILFGFLLTTIVFVGSLTSQFITISTRRSKYVRQLKNIENHMKLINMEPEIARRVIRYYEDLWYQKSGVFKPKLLELLPSPLQMEICYDLNAVPLYSSLIFRRLPESFLRRLSILMSHQFYLPEDIVYSQNCNKSNMVCITKGVIEFLSDEDDESPMISFTKGTCFGEISLVYNVPARCTVRAATYVECQVLDKKEYIKLMITYPDVVDIVRKEILDRIHRSHQRKTTQDNYGRISLNIYASKNKKKSSIKCLKDKLRYIQGQISTDPLSKEDYLDENCLDLYLISDNVKKSDQSFICLSLYFPWILESDSNLVRIWNLYMLSIVFFIALIYPYYIGYVRRLPGDFFLYFEIIINASLIFNICITCCISVKTKSKHIKTFREILSYRMNTLGFYLDLIAIIPFEYLVETDSVKGFQDYNRSHLFYLCKLIKLCLIWRVAVFFENLERKLLLNTIVVKICKYAVYILLLIFWSGVVLYMDSCFISRCYEHSWYSNAMLADMHASKDIDSSKIKYTYLTSTYLAATLLLSVGYGDFVPGDQFDMGLIAFLSIYGVLMMGFCIAEFSSLITHWSRTKTTFIEIVITIDKFMKENNFSEEIKSRIMAFYELQWQYNNGVDITGKDWIDKTVVPIELQKRAFHQTQFKALTSVEFFQVKNKAFIQTLTEKAKEIILPPNEIVYNGGTVSRELYIIESGYCILTEKEQKSGKREKTIGPGDYIGFLVLLFGIPCLNTVITLTHCKFLCIDHPTYLSALSLFPDMREHEGLLTTEELEKYKTSADFESAQRNYQALITPKTKKERIATTLQNLFNNSFINMRYYYQKQKKSYKKSFKEFGLFKNIAPYVLLPFVMKPDGIFIKYWTFLRIITAFLICLFVPITIAMAPYCKTFNKIITILEIICGIDMYIRLHVGYYGSKNQLIYHPYLTAKHYLTGAFVMDFLTSFPWYAILILLNPSHNEGHSVEAHRVNSHYFHCIFRLINVCQIYKLHIAFWTDNLNALRRAYLMSVVQFLILTLLFLNFYTSILLTISCRYVAADDILEFKMKVKSLGLRGPYMNTKFSPGGNMICLKGSWIDTNMIFKNEVLTPTRAYLYALYYTSGSFNGAAFGDFTAQDTGQLIISTLVILKGFFFFGYVYAKIASLKANSDQVLTRYLEDLGHLEMFLSMEKVALTLKKNVIDYFRYQWKRTGGWSHQSILGKLHANLREDAVLFMYESTLRDIPLFEGVECSFFRAFAKKLCERYYQKGHLVVKENEVISVMYIIYRGKVDIVTADNELETCMGPGGIFGNIRGAAKYLTLSNVIASRNIDLLIIDGAEFYALLKSYPTVMHKVQAAIDLAVKDYVIPVISADRSSEHATMRRRLTLIDIEEEEDDNDYGSYNGTHGSNQSPQKSFGSHSVTSIINALHTPAWSLIFLPHRWFRRSVLPDDFMVNLVDYLTLAISYLDFFLLVYQMAFMSIPFFLPLCVITDIFFLYKTFLDMHTGYMNRYGDYVLEPRKVRLMYFSNVFHRRRDFLVNFHISYFIFAFPFNPTLTLSFFTFLRMPQLFRITFLKTHKTYRKLNLGGSNLFLKLASMGIIATILSHVNACLWFKLSCLTKEHCTSINWMTKKELNLQVDYAEENYFAIYIASLWYTINVFTICGTGDITAQNDFEVFETVILTIIIKFCTGLLISEMSSMITAHNSSLYEYDYGINELRDGLRDMGLSQHQMTKMWDYVRELWTRQQGQQMPSLIQELPFRLQTQVMEAVYGYHIRESIIFKKTDDSFKRMLCKWLKHCVFFPGNYIVQSGDADQCIYFIHRGEVEVLTVHQNLTESIYDVLGPEDCFGIVQGIYVGVPHKFSFRARTAVDIVYLQLEQWKYLMDFYPKSAKIVTGKVQNIFMAT